MPEKDNHTTAIRAPTALDPGDSRAKLADESLDRSERAIAISRVLLSISAFAIILFDPRTPMYSARAIYIVLGAYIIYSSVLLWLFSYRGLDSQTTSKPILVADVAWYTVIVPLSEGSTSPFFLFYLFAICSAAIRWGVRTTVRVAISSAALYLASILVFRRLVIGPDFFLHSAHLLRPIYLVVLGCLVGIMGEHELSAKRRLIEMISMQREAGRSRSQVLTLARMLRRIVGYFDVDYVFVQMRPPSGSDWTWEGKRKLGQRLVLHTAPASPWTAASSGPLSFRVSHALGNWGRRVEVYQPGDMRPTLVSDRDEPGFLARSRTRSLISLPFSSAGGFRGRVLLGRGGNNFSREDISFGQTLLSQAAFILDKVALQAAAEELAVAQERARIARDVHDGFVQSLASIDVGIEVCRRLQEKDPARLSSELEDLQTTVKHGYREARRYLERLRTERPQGPDVDTAVRDIVREFHERGDVAIELEASAAGVPSRHGIGFEMLQIVREGLTNIVRHADASRASVKVVVDGGECYVTIRDDGKGFPAATDNTGTLLPHSAAPWSIRERVESLGGSLTLRSAAGGGSEIRITLPSRAER